MAFQLIPKDLIQSWPPIPTLNGSAPPVHVSLFPEGQAIPTQMVLPHQAVHQELSLQLTSREQINACQQAVNKCLSWPPAQYMTHLEEVEQRTTKSIKDAGFDRSETDKFSGNCARHEFGCFIPSVGCREEEKAGVSTLRGPTLYRRRMWEHSRAEPAGRACLSEAT